MATPRKSGLRKAWLFSTIVFFILIFEISRIGFNTAEYYVAAEWHRGLTGEQDKMWFDPEFRIHNPYPATSELRYINTSATKPKKIRVLVLGGSQTWGQYIDDWNDTLAGNIQKNLDGKGYDAEVLDGGVMGATTFTLLHFYKSTLQYYHPDIIVLNVGANDSVIWRGDREEFRRVGNKGFFGKFI